MNNCKVTCCKDCPFYNYTDRAGSFCRHPEFGIDQYEHIDEISCANPITPDWCPLKKEPLNISL